MGFWQGFALITSVHLLAAAAPGPDFVMVTQQTLLHGRRTGWWCSLGVALGLGVHMAYSIFGLAATIAHSQPLLQALRLAGGSYLLFLGWQSLRAGWPRAPRAKGMQAKAKAKAEAAAHPLPAGTCKAASAAATGPADATTPNPHSVGAKANDANADDANADTASDPLIAPTAVAAEVAARAAATPRAIASSHADATRVGAGATLPLQAASNTGPSARRSLLKGFFCNVLNPKAPLYFVSLFTGVLSPHLPLAQLLLYGLWMMVLHLAWFSAVALLLSQPRLQVAFLRKRHWVDRACGIALGLLGLRVLALLR